MPEEVYKHIYRIEIPLPGNPLKSLNAYCILGGERALLIDTGFNQSECRAALMDGLHALGVDRRKLDICVTHLHADHAGLAASVADGPCTIWCSAGDGQCINATTQGAGVFVALCNIMLPHGFDPEELKSLCAAHPGRKYAPDAPLPFTFVTDGDTLGYNGYTLRICSVPGHTPDSFALYEARHGLFFSGDHILGDITPNITRWADVRDSLGDYLRSLEESARLDITLTLPGHRSIIHDTGARIRQIQAHHMKRLDEVRRILAEAGPINAYSVASRMTWAMRYASWREFPVPQKWFATGEALAHLDRLTALGEAVEERHGETSLFRKL
ncbi:MAG: MBL fold metallo-hydrolase [Deltaproteobacteria bacterium]|jgi:glyoxylase-like metal-dependent hydrolase (beta-lactamase superfamily II)|nr:MBL fold metallo-hydrolase [Deltaproteobacteria bacterium]